MTTIIYINNKIINNKRITLLNNKINGKTYFKVINITYTYVQKLRFLLE